MPKISVFDLIFLEQDTGRTLSAGVIFDDGTDAQVGPFEFKGGLGPIRDAFMQFDPEQFDDASVTDARLIAAHFQNMSRGSNNAGQPYPIRVPKP